MCGIAGQVGAIAISDAIPAMLAAQSHRGPDGEGMWTSREGACRLGHKRLAIIDIDGGAQPLTSGDSGLWITFNGCIYNYRELRKELEERGHSFATQTDTEVILVAYAVWGSDCVERFNGMFAFAIWDERAGTLFCARDRLGIKPFYYIQDQHGFAFASEIKALLAVPGVTAAVDEGALQDYIVMQAPLGEQTLFAGIKRLQPGCWMELDNQGAVLEHKQYWRLAFTPTDTGGDAEQLEQLKSLLDDAVRLQMRADVAVGTHLSGGLDSSFITGAAAALVEKGSVHAFAGGFDTPGFDETDYAKLVALETRVMLHEVRPSAADFADSLEKICWHMDEPTAGPGVFPQYMVSRLAADHVKVVLGGQGGDEIFAGYARYLVCYLEECLKGAVEETADKAHYAATLASIIPSLPILQQYTPLLRHFWSDGLFGSHAERYYHMLDRSSDLQGLYAPEVMAGAGTRERFDGVFADTDALSFLDKIINLDTRVHLQGLLQVEDRVSMAWGLESRVPLLDHRIVEFMAQVPVVHKFRNGETKALFKQALQGRVPGPVLKRKDKMGFPVPLHEWLKGDLREFVGDLLLSERARSRGLYNLSAVEQALAGEAAFGRGIWGLMNIELWHRQFIDAA